MYPKTKRYTSICQQSSLRLRYDPILAFPGLPSHLVKHRKTQAGMAHGAIQLSSLLAQMQLFWGRHAAVHCCVKDDSGILQSLGRSYVS